MIASPELMENITRPTFENLVRTINKIDTIPIIADNTDHFFPGHGGTTYFFSFISIFLT